MKQKNNSQQTLLQGNKKKQEKSVPKPEIGGRKGPEPTRFGDWELNGKCVDF